MSSQNGKMTYKQVLSLDRAITRVRDKQNTMGATVPGCTFPSSIMFLNAWNQNHVKGTVDAIQEGVKPIMAKFKDKDDKWKKDGVKDFLKEEEKFLETEAKDIKPRKYSMKDLASVDDERFVKANEQTPVPQEYISLLMEAGLIEDDLDKK